MVDDVAKFCVVSNGTTVVVVKVGVLVIADTAGILFVVAMNLISWFDGGRINALFMRYDRTAIVNALARSRVT